MVRAPKQAMFASLCWRVRRASVVVCTTVARMPRWRFAAIAMPMPEPQTRMPKGTSPAATAATTLRA